MKFYYINYPFKKKGNTKDGPDGAKEDKKMEKFLPVLGRIFLAAIFIKSGIGKITSFSGTAAYMKMNGIPIAWLFLIGAIVFELVGALSMLLGWKAKWGAWLLIIFLIPTTLIFHSKLSDPMQMIMFIKNLAILGGLFMVAYFGSGPYSLKKEN